MGNVTQQIQRALDSKADIKAALEYHGLTVPNNTPFSQYAAKIRSIGFDNLAPTALTAEYITDHLELEWTINSLNAEGHVIYTSLDNVTYTVLDVVLGSENTYVSDALPEVGYYIQVKAFKGDALSDAVGTEVNVFGSVTTINLAIDGHSFIAPTNVIPPAYMSYTLPYAVNTVGEVYNGAVGGTNHPHLLENAETVDSKLVPEINHVANVLVVYSMNVSSDADSGVNNYNSYKTYLIARAAAGWKVFVFTLATSLQSTQPAEWIAEKEIFNNLLLTDLPLTKNCFAVDVDLAPELLDRNDLSIYYDGVHPSEKGGQLMLDLLIAKMQTVFSDKIIPSFAIPETNTLFALIPSIGVLKDVDNYVAEWNDSLGTEFKISQSDQAKKPLYVDNSLVFDGINDFMQSLPVTWNQPATIYLLLKQISWNIMDNIIAGNTVSSGTLYQSAATPSLKMYAGTAETPDAVGAVIGEWAIVKVIFDGANSAIKIGRTNTVPANVGTANMEGFTLANLPGYERYANVAVRAVVGRTVNDFRQQDEYVIYKFIEKLIEVNVFGSQIIALLNELTDTTDTVLGGMSNTQIAAECNVINAEII